MLYVDQYGTRFYASTVRTLCEQLDHTRATRMYVDGKDGNTYHIGFVIGKHWLRAYTPLRKKM